MRNDKLPRRAKLGHEYDVSVALDCGAQSVSTVTGCDEKCVRAQLEEGHRQMGVTPSDKAFKSKQKANVALFKKPPIAAPAVAGAS